MTEEEARIRAEERARCAKLIEGISGCYGGVSVVPEKIADSEWAEVAYNVNRKAKPNQKVPLWLIKVAVEYASFVTFERGRKILASAIRSATDTDYVCVRREELEALTVAAKPFFDEEEQWHEMGGTRILSHATKLNVAELRALCDRLRSLLKEKG